MQQRKIIESNIVDLFNERIFYGRVFVENCTISSILELGAEKPGEPYAMPGFTDSHVHIESSMLVPSEFARLAVVHGTVATVSDPHEIANVCGVAGIEYMLHNAWQTDFHFYFGAPSCVPATRFESAGAMLDAEIVELLLERKDIFYLSEMMNFPGVLTGDREVMEKIAAAKRFGKPIDGHAPGLRGTEAAKYIAAGISTDHECFTEDEAAEKLKLGMKILIREGSAAKNFEALIALLGTHPNEMMFCTDDMHPDSLAAGHINKLCARAIAKGIPLINVLRAACINPHVHYNLTHGLLRESDPADFILVKDLQNFEVISTFIKAEQVAADGRSLLASVPAATINNFECKPKVTADFAFQLAGSGKHLPVIEALDGQLITDKIYFDPGKAEGNFESDLENDILKIVVVNRYRDAPPAIAFIKNFGLKTGAIASTVAHDSHNILAVGVDDAAICGVVNALIETKGGIAAEAHRQRQLLPLPVAGLMTNADGYETAKAYSLIDAFVKKEMGCTLSAPFMTLSFMALLVIPHLKLSDRGLFDADRFEFVSETPGDRN